MLYHFLSCIYILLHILLLNIVNVSTGRSEYVQVIPESSGVRLLDQ